MAGSRVRKSRARGIKLNLGKQWVGGEGRWPSEAGYVSAMASKARALTDDLLAIVNAFEDATPEIIMEALEPTFEKAKYYVPKDTWDLHDSAYLEITSFRGKPRVEMGFARGGNPPYGMFVHEIERYRHASPTRSKFLEAAMKEDLGDIPGRLKSAYQRLMGSVA